MFYGEGSRNRYRPPDSQSGSNVRLSHGGSNNEYEEQIPLNVRPYEDRDCEKIGDIARRNIEKSFVLFPEDVVTAYLAANSEDDIRHAAKADGTEIFVAEKPDNTIGGFFLIRFNPFPRTNAYGELDLRRLHVDPDFQGQGVGRKLFEKIEERARKIKVAYITSHASGSSRSFFEQHGWVGTTILNEMTNRGTQAIVFAATKGVTRGELQLFEKPTHVIYAGSNKEKKGFIDKTLRGLPEPSLSVSNSQADEDPTENVVEAAKSKAHSVSSRLRLTGEKPLIIASDIRTDLLAVNGSGTKYFLQNRGKPQSPNRLDEIRDNFLLMKNTAENTKKPAPYITRSATFLHSPTEPQKDTYSEYDVSVWLTKEALEILSTSEGLTDYRNEVYDTYGIDITQMAAGFALPVFLKRGYVAGINGHPFDTLPHREKTIEKALHTVIVGIDGKAIQQRLGYFT